MLKIVLHYLDNTLLKGTTNDFNQNRPSFHVHEQPSGQMKMVDISELKAIFFVKSFEGNPNRIERTDVERAGFGRKIKVQFKDGETIFGYTTSYTPGRPAFFVFPADPESNNQRIFVLEHSTENVELT